MRKWIIMFVISWLFVGVYLFVLDNEADPSKLTKVENNYTNQSPLDFTASYAWIVDDEEQGNYTSPYWVRDDSLAQYVEEIDHTSTHRNNTPEYQVLTFFAEAQFGNPRQLTAYLSAGKRSEDFDDISIDNIDLIDQKLNEFAEKITRDRTIKALYASPPKKDGDSEHITFDLLIEIKGDGLYEIVDLPLLVQAGGIDLTLTEISSLVQTAQKTEKNPRVD